MKSSFGDFIAFSEWVEKREKDIKEKDKDKAKSGTKSSGNFLELLAILLILFPVIGPAAVYAWAWSFVESARMLHTIWP